MENRSVGHRFFSEACMLGGVAAWLRWRKKDVQAQGKPIRQT